jgi:hypothetical protein
MLPFFCPARGWHDTMFVSGAPMDDAMNSSRRHMLKQIGRTAAVLGLAEPMATAIAQANRPGAMPGHAGYNQMLRPSVSFHRQYWMDQ